MLFVNNLLPWVQNYEVGSNPLLFGGFAEGFYHAFIILFLARVPQGSRGCSWTHKASTTNARPWSSFVETHISYLTVLHVY